MNFCPLSINEDNSDEYLIAVAKHEILHALVRLHVQLLTCIIHTPIINRVSQVVYLIIG